METDNIPMEEKRADATIQLEIDEAILDYLAYKAIKAVLRDSQNFRDPSAQDTRKPKCALQLDLIDSFLVMFRAMHSDYQGTQELQLRLRLLRFATLFTKRESVEAPRSWTQELQSLPSFRQEKANDFKSTMYVPDLTKQLVSSGDLKWIKKEHDLGAKALERAKGTDKASLPLVSLLDTLPSFMALSAAENVMRESKITDTWMRLAAGYMAQAVIEQYLLYGSQSDKIFEKAFGWGFDPETVAKERSEDWIINAMFLDEEAEFESWQQIKNEHMRALIPPVGRDFLDHLRMLRESELSLAGFEHTLLNFLEGLLHSLPSPILVQTESGMIEETSLSQQDTQALKERIGVA